jgi:hypothetical protein
MGVFDRVEQRIERAVNGVFARAFKSEVQPVEIASAVRRAMDDRAAVLGRGRTIVPNLFTVELSETDYEHLTAYADELTDELVASAQEHAETQRYTPGGPVHVHFECNEELETGVFQLRPSTARAARRQQHAPRPQHQPHEPQQPDHSAYGPPAGRMPEPEPGAPVAPPPAQHPAAAPQQAPPTPPRPQRQRPSAAHRPWLDIDGQRYPLLSAITVLGRDDSADVVLDDPGISRQHSAIRVTSDGPHLLTSIRDLDSTNGTFVNGERVRSQRLSDGDRVTVGRTALTFRLGGRR